MQNFQEHLRMTTSKNLPSTSDLFVEVCPIHGDVKFQNNKTHEHTDTQKQPSRGVLNKRYSENMQQIYIRTPMPKCDFNKVAKQLYQNHTSA